MFLNIQGDRSDTPHVSSQSGGAGRGSKTAVEKSALLRRWYTVTSWLGRIRLRCQISPEAMGHLNTTGPVFDSSAPQPLTYTGLSSTQAPQRYPSYSS